jgi:hypothetical protein
VAAQLLPAVILPGLLYFIVSRFASPLQALAGASSVPVLDALVRLLRGKRPSRLVLAVLPFLTISQGLAMVLRSPMFILARGAVMSAGLGLAFTLSAVLRRPLIRTVAILLLAEDALTRRSLTERWGHPVAQTVFRTLSWGWGILLVLSALQQAVVVLSFSPGTVMATEPSAQAAITILGSTISFLYVRRMHRRRPELGLLIQAGGR